MRLGLGTGDAIVRARLAQRMSASLAASLPAPPVAPDELERACATEAARAPERARVAFWFVPKDLPGAADEADAIVRLLRAGGPRSAHGRGQRPPIPDGAVWSEEALAAVTGAAVAHAALHAPVGEAAGPFAAAWGFYVLVPLERRRAEPAEVRADVQAALLRDKQAAAIEAWIGRARRDYVIDVRAPEGQQSFDLAARTGRTAK